MNEWLSAGEAALRLGVSRATLYAYVSRGRLALHAAPGTHARRYRAGDVERLAAQHTRAHRPREAARATLDWGLPVLGSALTLIEDGRFYYRGQDALALAAGTATLEDVAAPGWSRHWTSRWWPCGGACSCRAAPPSICSRSRARWAGSRMRWSSALAAR